jgi:hypothetical protein
MLPLVLFACSDAGLPPLAVPTAPCEVPGTICTWLGVPNVARTSDDGLTGTAAGPAAGAAATRWRPG